MSHINAYEASLALSPTSLSPQQQHPSSQQDALLSSSSNQQHPEMTMPNDEHNANAANANSMMCFAQLQDDANHKHCSTGNRKSLLSESLDRLGKLTKDLEETDWMFGDSSMMGVGGNDRSGGRGGGDCVAPRGQGLEERHFSFGRRL